MSSEPEDYVKINTMQAFTHITGGNNAHVSVYLLLPADGAMFGNPLQASTVHSAVLFNLLHLL